MRAPALRVGVADIQRRPGTRLDVQRTLPAAELGELHVLDATVPAAAEIDLDLVLESIPDGIVATGTVTVPFEAACRRCLKPVAGTTRHEIREVFERHPTEGETYPLGHDEVDLEPLVRDVVLLGLPAAPLCGDDCKGPVPEAFEAGDPEPEPDPRWAVLEDLDFDQ